MKPFVFHDHIFLSKSFFLLFFSQFESLEKLASHVTISHAIAGIDNLYYCKWEGCLRSHRGFNARYKMLVHCRTHTREKPVRIFNDNSLEDDLLMILFCLARLPTMFKKLFKGRESENSCTQS